jgi:lipopolysaccharide transport system ATP-binding protein
MTNNVAIRVDGLSKQYRIGLQPEKYKTMRDSLANGFGNLFNRKANAEETATFWAVRDLSFEIKPGEVVGVIGRNGAGKSTLLKLLARITEPTRGHAEIHGRIGALLEVGTGFHQELSGRENIYLNGAILGMRRAEIDRKFDEIVEFSEVGKFIDTPVKRYSSGMHLRLAFSVAAHLEPEILLVDEVLAVGDVAFQKKCVGKMEDVAAHGRTVLFVSHNLAAVKELCQTSLVLSNGQLEYRGSVTEGLARYSQTVAAGDENNEMRGTRWRHVGIAGQTHGVPATVLNNEPFTVEATLDLQRPLTRGLFFCIITDAVGDQVVHQRIEAQQLGHDELPPGSYQIKADFPALWLAPGVYTAYFKFIGYNPAGGEEKQTSERTLIDIIGQDPGISRSKLTPPFAWTVTTTASN